MALISARQKRWMSFFFLLALIIPLGGLSLVFFTTEGQFNSEGISTSNSSPEVDFSDLPPIDYQALNESWYDQNIEMLIIVPDENYVDEVQPLADWKNQKGVKTLILSNYTEYNGTDGPEQIRNMIKSYYESDGIRWVLLAGDTEEIPIRYAHNPDLKEFRDMWDDFNDYEPFGSEEIKPTDYYYADLTGTWDSNNNSIYGESAKYNDEGGDEIDWSPEVYVGRLPANGETELSEMIDKTLKYEKNPEIGDWMHDMLLAGGVSSMPSSEDPDGEDEAKLTSYIIQNYVQKKMNYTHLCATTPSYTPPVDYTFLDHSSFDSEFDNEGHSTVFFAGHGNPTIYADMYNRIYSARTLYTDSDAQNVQNSDMPSLVYADACATSTYDNDDNIGEYLIKDSDGGAIGVVGALRVTLYYNNDEELEALNRGNAKLFWKVFFEDHTYQQGKTLYDSKVAYMNSHYYQYERNLDLEQADRKNLLTYNLLGDPEVDIYTDLPGKVSEDPFPSTLYEGQMVNITLYDNYSRPVSNPRLYIYNEEEGIARTVYGDGDGNVKFRLPLGADITYNVSISGHNLLGLSNFTFSTQADNDDPKINSAELLTQNPTASKNLHYQINTSDDASGIESVFLLFSTDNFDNYFYYHITNEFTQDESFFHLKTDKFEPGSYKYLVYTRDYTNKSTSMYQSSFRVDIAIPISYYVLIGSIVGIACIALASGIFYFRSIKLYPNKLRKLQRAQA